MDSTPSSLPSRRRTFDLPKSSPDAGLAEWTSKIKAIQQEVDRDEEVEQRRLQEEIEKSRMERAKRRSALPGYGTSPNRVELPAEGPSKPLKDPSESHSEALRKLTGSSSFPSPSPSQTGMPPSQEGTSLAAFMGGRATGPKLNKPTPQADSYDANTYDQTRREGPHPIFGQPNPLRGTPSNAKLGERSTDGAAQENKPQVLRPFSPALIHTNERTHPTKTPSPPPIQPQAVKPIVQLPSKPPISKKPSGDYLSFPKPQKDSKATQPELSPPITVKPVVSVTEPLQQKSTETGGSAPPIAPPKPLSLSQAIGGRAAGPKLTKLSAAGSTDPVDRPQVRPLPGMNTDGASRKDSLPYAAPITPPKPEVHRASTLEATPSARPTSASPPSRPSSTPVVTTSLARPIQPRAEAPPSIMATASAKPSPAFLRVSPSTQELHPSLTRLQARGIVEKRVKAASQIFREDKDVSEAKESSSPSSPLPASKRPTVLDRWQPTTSGLKPSHPSQISSHSASKQDQGLYRQLPGMATGSALGRPSVNHSSKTGSTAAAPIRLPGMASSMSIPPAVRIEKETTRVSDSIAKAKEDTTSASGTSHDMTTAPLSHPTRDRARKPRKQASTSTKQASEEQTQFVALESPSTPPVNVYGQEQKSLEESITQQQPKLTFPTSDSSFQRIQALKNELSYPMHKAEASTPPPLTIEATTPSPAIDGKYAGLEGLGRPKPSNIQMPSVVSPRPMAPSSPQISPDGGPPTPRPRIPSTGTRATVMDVAQALLEHEKHIREASFTPELETETPPSEEEKEEEEEVEELPPAPDVKSIVAGWGRSNLGQQQPQERRRSTYESRFSVATLPPLVEVKTPADTPQASLSRGFAQTEQQPPTAQQLHTVLNECSLKPNSITEEPATAETGESDAEDATGPEQLPDLDVQIAAPVLEDTPISKQNEPGPNGVQPKSIVSDIPVQQATREETVFPSIKVSKDDIVHLDIKDGIPPAFNLQALLKEAPFIPDLKSQTISVDILVISGNSTTTITEEPNVFYDSEVVCVIHRSKNTNSELVSNRVWVWRGQHAIFGENEARKGNELAERYGTTAIQCMHGSEPPNLIHTLGGVLAIRQGLRAHWSAENTAMHRVLRVGDSIFVDEIDLAIWNLCSAYSYCLCILGNTYIWHGCGSSEDERKVASTYAQSLTKASSSIIELEEGAEDDMFWMMLGNDGYANADHWRLKGRLDRLGSRIFSINSSQRKAPVQVLPSPSGRELLDGNVFVVDCRFEVFVVVPTEARGKRIDIQLGIFLAQNISATIAHKRPFNPPIHVIVLPSKLPLELRAAIRLCDESKLNGGLVPDHMNLLHLGDAIEHMQRRSWTRSLLSDTSFLPLGIEPAMLEVVM